MWTRGFHTKDRTSRRKEVDRTDDFGGTLRRPVGSHPRYVWTESRRVVGPRRKGYRTSGRGQTEEGETDEDGTKTLTQSSR